MINFKLCDRLKNILVIFLISYNNFFVGCLMIFSSVLFVQLREPSSPITINTNEASWIASISSLTSPIGLIAIGILTDKIGRKSALQISFIPIIASFLILAYSNSYVTILIGRTIGGLILGSDSCMFVYATEVCPPNRRQIFFAFLFMFVSFGILTESVITMFLSWQTVSLIFAMMAAVGLLLLFVLPESPVWLRAHGRVSEAESAEQWFGLSGETSAATDDAGRGSMATTADTRPQDTPLTFWSSYTRRTVWVPALIMFGLCACQQGCGLFVMVNYSADVLRGFQVYCARFDVNVILSVSRLMGNVMFILMHNVKRKTMATTSFAGMAVSLMVVVGYAKIFPYAGRPFGQLVGIVAFVAYTFFALLGALQFPWTLSSELFPSDVTGTMNGIIQSSSYFMMFVVTKLYPTMASHFGVETCWSLFAIVCSIGVLFSIYILPETKGIPLNDILARFESPKKTSKNDVP